MYRLESGVSESVFKDCINAGGKLRIVCGKDAQPTKGSFRGHWRLYAQNPEQGDWVRLNLFRAMKSGFNPRIFRTANGLLGFVIDLGFPAGAIPFKKGAGIETDKQGNMRFIDHVSDD